MTEQEIWIEAPDASSAAFLMRHLVGRLQVRLVQCTGRGWRVLVRPDRGGPSPVADVIPLVREWLHAYDLTATRMHVGTAASPFAKQGWRDSGQAALFALRTRRLRKPLGGPSPAGSAPSATTLTPRQKATRPWIFSAAGV